MGSNVNELKSYCGVKDMEMVWVCDCEEDLMGVTREVMIGLPWKDDLWSKKEDLGPEESEEVRVVDMAAIMLICLDTCVGLKFAMEFFRRVTVEVGI